MSKWTLQMFADRETVVKRLAATQLSPSSVSPKAALFVQVAESLLALGLRSDSPATAWYVPGRIEVLGKHTDYVGGRSLTAAAERGFCSLAVPRGDARVQVLATQNAQTVEFQLEPLLKPAIGHWSNYPMTVARRVAQNFPGDLRGADIAFASDLPFAAGMSSSSALIISMFLLLSEVNHLSRRDAYRSNIPTTLDLAGYQATIENGQSFGELAGDQGVGTFGGSEDHTAILCSQAGQLGQFSYCPVRHERWVDVPDRYLFAIASSGVIAEKTGAAMEKYNRASKLAAEAAEVWRETTGQADQHLAAAIGSSTNAEERIRKVLRESSHPDFNPAELLSRFEHFLAESVEIIPAVADVLDDKSLGQFGKLVDRSQSLGRELLGNQVPETVFLANTARALGAAAASAFGAGFGGSVWALIEKDQAEAFLPEWNHRYCEAFPKRADAADFFVLAAGPAAFPLVAL